MINARRITSELLLKMEKGAYSNIALNAALSAKSLSDTDKRLVSRLFYGVTERKITLDYIISLYSKKEIKKLDSEIISALRIGLYELLYCVNIPQSASVSEAVNLTKSMGKSSAAGFVNGILRSFIRDEKKFPLPNDKQKAFSVKYSVSDGVAGILLDSLSYEKASKLLEYSFLPGDMTLRVNTVKTDSDKLLARLSDEKIRAVPIDIPFLNGTAVKVLSGNDRVLKSKAFADGLFHVQDISSQICTYAVSPDENMTVTDICAAPGGKSFAMSEMMKNTGRICSCELHKKRTGLIKDGASRLGLSNITAIQNDGRVFSEKLPSADRVLCDVPCSGLGTIRGKPEIKYKSADEISRLPEIQYGILETSSRYVKCGGDLIYSTCTVNRAENENVTEKFLQNHREFYGVSFLPDNNSHSVTILPEMFDSDGFYICKMRRKNS